MRSPLVKGRCTDEAILTVNTPNEDFELTLFDRLEMIRMVMQFATPEEAYIAFSGGKDSVVLSHMIDEAMLNNRYERVFSNTGLEYSLQVKFVEELQKEDSRIVILPPEKNIKTLLEEVGYPFKSKLHSELVERYQRTGMTSKSVQKYTADSDKSGRYHCPKALRYQFQEPGLDFKVSQKCCLELKKKPIREYARRTGKTMKVTGIRASEGGIREYSYEKKGCVFREKDGSVYEFHPLSPCSDAFIDWYVKTRNIRLSDLYYPPYSMERTGCKGCPYNIRIADDLAMMEKHLPAERKQCELIWGVVYDEYRRIGYRKMKGNEDE